MVLEKADLQEKDLCRARVVNLERVERARAEAPGKDELERLAEVYKVLGNPTRLRMLMALRDGEMCVCDLSAFLGLSESAVSHQLRRLKDLSLVRQRRERQVLYNSLDDEHVSLLLNVGLEHLLE